MATGPYKCNLHITALTRYPPDSWRILRVPPTHIHTNGKRLRQVVRKVGGTNTRPVISWNATLFGQFQDFHNVGCRAGWEAPTREPGRTWMLQAKNGVIVVTLKSNWACLRTLLRGFWIYACYCYVLHLFSVLPAVQRTSVLFWNITSSILSFTEVGKSRPLIPKALLCYFSERIIQRPLRDGACWYAHTVPKQGSRWSCPWRQTTLNSTVFIRCSISATEELKPELPFSSLKRSVKINLKIRNKNK